MTDNHLRLVEPPDVDDDEDDDGDGPLLAVEATVSGADDVYRSMRLITDPDLASVEDIAELMIAAMRGVASATSSELAMALDQKLMFWGRT